MLDLLCALLSSSLHIREQFVQIHGFHLVGLAIHQLTTALDVTKGKDQSNNNAFSTFYQNRNGCSGFTCELVDKCFHLSTVMGLVEESHDKVSCISKVARADIAAAACQGLLFNFQLVWGFASITVKEHLLTKFSSFILRTPGTTAEQVEGELLLKYVGVQQLLDVLKLYIPSSTSSKASDLCIRLITVAINAAIFKQVEKSQIDLSGVVDSLPQFPEIEMLLYSLEESMNGNLVEYLLRVLCSLQFSSPACLLPVLQKNQFVETSPLTLLTQGNLSLQVRRMTLLLLLWTLGWECEHSLSVIAHKLKDSKYAQHDSPQRRVSKDVGVFKKGFISVDSSHNANVSKLPVSFVDSAISTPESTPASSPSSRRFSGTMKLRSLQAPRNLSIAFTKLMRRNRTPQNAQEECQEHSELCEPLESSWEIVCRVSRLLTATFVNTPWCTGTTNSAHSQVLVFLSYSFHHSPNGVTKVLIYGCMFRVPVTH